MIAEDLERTRHELVSRFAATSRRYMAQRAERNMDAPLLRRVEVRNFRNIRGAIIPMAPITVLIGENNVGKTNLLTAIGCLFPTVFEEKLTNFGVAIGDLGFRSAADHFISFDENFTQIGATTSDRSFWLGIYNRYTLVKTAWYRGTDLMAMLLASCDLTRRRWLSEPIGKIDGRRLGKSSRDQRAQNYELGQLLQAELVGSARVALNLNPETEGSRLDDFEIQLPAMAARSQLSVQDFLKTISDKLGMPRLRFNRFEYLSWPILPSPTVSRRSAKSKSELESLITTLRDSIHSTGEAGRALLKQALADSAALENKGGVPGGGGLLLEEGWGLAKGLGSGHRRALLLASQLLTHDLCLIDEPEIYLHPRMLERLLGFIVECSSSCQVVMTTHSPVVIDYLYERPDVRMYEVTGDVRKPNGQLVNVTSNLIHSIVEELGWRPAHLLHANAIVWVEGPSDVIYVNRWIELWSHGRIRPHRDYVCVPYGGSLLKHLGSEDTGGDTIWNVNRNSIVVCDSDREHALSAVAEYKLTIAARIKERGGYSWITERREIENYLPRRLLAPRAVGELPKDYSYADVPRMLGKARRKSDIAKELAPLLDLEDIMESPLLVIQISKICDILSTWARVDTRSPGTN
jgi:hypothetical protein